MSINEAFELLGFSKPNIDINEINSNYKSIKLMKFCLTKKDIAKVSDAYFMCKDYARMNSRFVDNILYECLDNVDE